MAQHHQSEALLWEGGSVGHQMGQTSEAWDWLSGRVPLVRTWFPSPAPKNKNKTTETISRDFRRQSPHHAGTHTGEPRTKGTEPIYTGTQMTHTGAGKRVVCFALEGGLLELHGFAEVLMVWVQLVVVTWYSFLWSLWSTSTDHRLLCPDSIANWLP